MMSEPARTPEPEPGPSPTLEPIPEVKPLRPELTSVPTLPPTPMPAATAEAPTPHRRGGRVFGSAMVAWIIVVVAIAAAGTGFFLRQSAANDLSSTRATLATSQSNLHQVQGTLATTRGTLATTREQVTTLQAENGTLSSSNAALDKKVNACQTAYRIDYLVSNGRMNPNATTYQNWLTAITACYGKVPAYMK